MLDVRLLRSETTTERQMRILTARPRNIIVLITFGIPVFSCRSSTENN